MTEVVGNTLVDSRYRIINKIGSGGMADVFCAEDTHLGRQVALKVLHRRFAQDQEFVERFRREAKAAAGLQHPHVVGVFDRGEHDGTYYIAMEYLRGRTLKQEIDAEAPFDQLRAIDAGIQILRAAAFAHRRGLIHRDFKPQNVISDDNGAVKVTDFGIARAGASEMTETGSIMGTAQYLSPEQAQGHGVTAASDLYSIAIILYEMLSRRVPFEGDSAVSVALKHLNESPPPLGALRPDVHPQLEYAVMRGLAKHPDDRFADADEFILALESARERIAAGDRGPAQETMVYAAPAADQTFVSDAPPPDAERRRRRRVPFVLVLLLLVAGAAAAYALTRPDEVAVPDVTGKTLLEASTQLEAAGFQVAERRVQDVQPADTVIRQDPTGGTRADEGSTIRLVVSSGPGRARVPDVEGLSKARAIRELGDAGFKVTEDEEPHDRIREGLAIRTVPEGGTEADRGERIRLFVSSGPERVTVPDVTGASRANAESRLEAEGLVPVVEERESDSTQGTVLSQSPSGGSDVVKGTRVTVVVSRGTDEVSVPNVVGSSPSAASAALQSAGFGVDQRERRTENPDDDGVVIDQSPDGGTRRTKGRTVIIYVGSFRAPAPEPPAVPPEP